MFKIMLQIEYIFHVRITPPAIFKIGTILLFNKFYQYKEDVYVYYLSLSKTHILKFSEQKVIGYLRFNRQICIISKKALDFDILIIVKKKDIEARY